MTAPVVDTLRARLPALTSQQRTAARLASDMRLAGVWASWAAEGGLEVDFTSATPQGPVFAVALSCHLGSCLVLVAAGEDPGLAYAVEAAETGPVGLLALEAAMQPALAVVAKDPVLAGLHATGIAAADGRSLRGRAWSAVRDGSRAVMHVALAAVSDGLAEALQVRAAMTAPPSAARRSMRVKGWLELATQVVPLGVLRTLAVGDVVVLPLAAPDLNGTQQRWRVGEAGGRLALVPVICRDAAWYVSGEMVMTDEDDALLAGADDEVDSLAALELPVRFEVETGTMALADLEAMVPGYVIDFRQALDQASLRLVCCGRVVGYAELVAVGDGLGARITRMVVRDEYEQHR